MNRITLFSLCLLSIVFYGNAFAESESKKIEMKCHVKLLGGNDLIYFTRVKTNKSTRLASLIQGTTIKINKNKTEKIYKVVECKKLNSLFTAFISKQLDERTVR